MCLSQLAMWYWSWSNWFAVLAFIPWFCFLLALQSLEDINFVELVQSLARVAVFRLSGWVTIRVHGIQEIICRPLRVVRFPLVHTWLIRNILPMLVRLKPWLDLLNQLIKKQPLHHRTMLNHLRILDILLLASTLFVIRNEDLFLNLIIQSAIELKLTITLVSNNTRQLEKVIFIHATRMLYLNGILIIFFFWVCNNFIFVVQIGFDFQIFSLLELRLNQRFLPWLRVLFILTCFTQILIWSLWTSWYLHLGWFRLFFLLALVMNRTFPTMSFDLLADVFLYIFHVQHFKMLLLAWLTAFVFIDWLSLIWIEADVFLVHVWIYFLFDFVIAFSVASEWQQWWHVGFIFEWAWIHTYFL